VVEKQESIIMSSHRKSKKSLKQMPKQLTFTNGVRENDLLMLNSLSKNDSFTGDNYIGDLSIANQSSLDIEIIASEKNY
jgi:hypothetical protein